MSKGFSIRHAQVDWRSRTYPGDDSYAEAAKEDDPEDDDAENDGDDNHRFIEIGGILVLVLA